MRIDLPQGFEYRLAEIGISAGLGDAFLRVGYIKAFMDGTLGSQTARMLDGSGVEITSRGRASTRSTTDPAPDVASGTPGNARPSSSAVRRAPTTEDRSRGEPQCAHSKRVSTAPHQRQVGGCPGPRSANGPAQTRQRAGRRQSWQESDGR